MTNTKRQDVHSPSNFIPEHYRALAVLDLYAGTERDDVSKLAISTQAPGSWQQHVEQTRSDVAVFQKVAIGDHPELHRCSICGARIRYAVIWSYEPKGESLGIITSGLDCAESVDAARASELRDKVGALKEFVSGVRRMVREAEQAHLEMPVRSAADQEEDVWIARDPSHADVAAFLDEHARAHVDMPTDECILCSFAYQLAEKGHLTERQVTVARDRAERAQPLLPPEGEGIEVIGTVRSVKAHASGSMHALVDVPERRRGLRLVAAHRVWLPVRRNLPRGTRIRFVANLSASRNDPHFLIASDVSGQAVVGD